MIEIVAVGHTLTVNCTLYTVNCLSFQRNDKPEFGAEKLPEVRPLPGDPIQIRGK